MKFDELIRTNGTCRYYETTEVSNDVLARVLDASRWAPSGGNRQPLSLIAVRDQALKTQLQALYQPIWNEFLNGIYAGEKQYKARPKLLIDADHFAKHIDQIPVLLIVCARLADVQPTDVALDRLSIVGGASIYPAVQNILLKAREEGLGTALTTLLCAVEPAVKSLLGIPADISTAAMVTIGWPSKPFPRSLTRRPLSEIAFIDHYGSKFDEP
ncbi:MAG: nitroreductase family protein [Proteobacteria bacterium]|nr:nitroreductase family protein [Pseudomonadota bacterium]